MYVSTFGKLSEIHFNVLLFSNQGENVLIFVESKGQIYTPAFIISGTFSPVLENNATLKWTSAKKLNVLTKKMLDPLQICWKRIIP